MRRRLATWRDRLVAEAHNRILGADVDPTTFTWLFHEPAHMRCTTVAVHPDGTIERDPPSLIRFSSEWRIWREYS